MRDRAVATPTLPGAYPPLVRVRRGRTKRDKGKTPRRLPFRGKRKPLWPHGLTMKKNAPVGDRGEDRQQELAYRR
jgi:hypothetical protein